MSNLGFMMVFRHDKWVSTHITDLVKGEAVFHAGKLLLVANEPRIDAAQNKAFISFEKPDVTKNVIVLAVGDEWRGRQATTQVMDYMGADAHDFDDGTSQISIMEAGPGAIYSPRLPVAELEAWCVENLDRFEKIFDENERDLDSGKVVTLKPWWK